MAIGERIHFFRTLRGMTQKYLGVRLGFDEKSADVRIAQYESGTRSPKDNYIALLADTLGVSPLALLMEKSVLVSKNLIIHPILSFLTTLMPGMNRPTNSVKVRFPKKNMTNGATITP